MEELDIIERLIDARMRLYLLDIEKKTKSGDKNHVSQLDGYIAKLFLLHIFTDKILSMDLSEEKRDRYVARCLAMAQMFESRIEKLSRKQDPVEAATEVLKSI